MHFILLLLQIVHLCSISVGHCFVRVLKNIGGTSLGTGTALSDNYDVVK